ncbi:extensin-like, partial [Diaphorina citri]|uniref:Extensin-like n=1 Tax=Diaphorina citri TaxID=121845 RepID=A0A3Q0JF17_DIACI
ITKGQVNKPTVEQKQTPLEEKLLKSSSKITISTNITKNEPTKETSPATKVEKPSVDETNPNKTISTSPTAPKTPTNVTAPTVPTSVTAPKTPTSAIAPTISTSVTAPKTPTSATAPTIPTSVTAPKTPTSATAPTMPTSVTAPKTPTSATAPTMPTSVTAPKTPTSATAPTMPTSVTAPKTPTSATAPTMPTSVTAPKTPTSATAPTMPTSVTPPKTPTSATSPKILNNSNEKFTEDIAKLKIDDKKKEPVSTTPASLQPKPAPKENRQPSPSKESAQDSPKSSSPSKMAISNPLNIPIISSGRTFQRGVTKSNSPDSRNILERQLSTTTEIPSKSQSTAESISAQNDKIIQKISELTATATTNTIAPNTEE